MCRDRTQELRHGAVQVHDLGGGYQRSLGRRCSSAVDATTSGEHENETDQLISIRPAMRASRGGTRGTK
jgi:hypothetical protein